MQARLSLTGWEAKDDLIAVEQEPEAVVDGDGFAGWNWRAVRGAGCPGDLAFPGDITDIRFEVQWNQSFAGGARLGSVVDPSKQLILYPHDRHLDHHAFMTRLGSSCRMACRDGSRRGDLCPGRRRVGGSREKIVTRTGLVRSTAPCPRIPD